LRAKTLKNIKLVKIINSIRVVDNICLKKEEISESKLKRFRAELKLKRINIKPIRE
jgi:hypothetical protein